MGSVESGYAGQRTGSDAVDCAHRWKVQHGLDRFLGWPWPVEADGGAPSAMWTGF